jgi:hypothetical protein
VIHCENAVKQETTVAPYLEHSGTTFENQSNKKLQWITHNGTKNQWKTKLKKKIYWIKIVEQENSLL